MNNLENSEKLEKLERLEERKEMKERFIKDGVPFLIKLEKTENAKEIEKEENGKNNTYSVIVNGHVQGYGNYDEMLQEYNQCIFVHG